MASQPRRCSNTDCNLAVDGRCVEDYPLEECPHVVSLDVEDIEEVDEPQAPEPPTSVPLALGEALARSDASDLQRRRASRAVGIVAPNDAGKTSLIASVYDLLQNGPIAGVGFAGSSTLIGFEKVCHDARTSSRRELPHMERTSAGADATFFHLDLRPEDQDVVSLFIADRSGEDYLAAADDLSRANGFFELRRADVLTVLVNGDYLASSAQRHETRAITPQLVDALLEAGVVRSGCRLAIVLTKQDVVLASPHAARVQADFDELVDSIVADHATHFREIERFVVAASPRNAAHVGKGQGVGRLVHFWLRAAAEADSIPPPSSASTRFIDLLSSGEEAK
jgi:hypothetical protein